VKSIYVNPKKERKGLAWALLPGGGAYPRGGVLLFDHTTRKHHHQIKGIQKNTHLTSGDKTMAPRSTYNGLFPDITLYGKTKDVSKILSNTTGFSFDAL
jgi:hypothetical protein